MSLRSKLPNHGGLINHIILQYKRHAKKRGIEWSLSREEVDALVRQPCHYCGITGGNLKKTKNCKDGFRHNGIDRLDSSGQYIAGNVVACCGLCNVGKRAMSEADFIAWAMRIADHHRQRGCLNKAP